jgi:drug/metabolite transporter (DMT)-like permease
MNHATTHAKLTLVAAAWGVAWTAGRYVATDLSEHPITAAWLRYLIAVPVFLLWLHVAKGLQRPTGPQRRRVVAIGLCSTVLYQVFFMLGMRWTAAGDASLVITLNPLFTGLLAVVVLGQRLTSRLGGGLVLGLLGVTVLFVASPNADIPASERWLGNGFIALAALSWASSTLMMRRAMDVKASEHDGPMGPLELTVWASTAGLLMLTPLTGWETVRHGVPDVGVVSMASIAFLALISTVLTYVWFAQGVERIGASRASAYVYLVPIFGILSGWLILGEHLGLSLVLAFALIIGGVMLAQSEPAKT